MGRPRKIPEEEGVARALRVFWEKGYDRTSIADLSEALEVGPSGIYNAFGSKEGLFARAVEHYLSRYATFAQEAADADLDVEPLVRHLLRQAVKGYTDPDTPAGCVVMQAAGSSGPEASRAAAITLEVKGRYEEMLRKVLEQASRKHGTRLAGSARVTAKYLIATLRGLSQLAIDGASVRDLNRICDMAARACVEGQRD